MNRLFLLGSVALGLATVASPAMAESLNVTGTVAPYCNVNLANVSSGTASIAMVGTQQVANLRLSCNAASGTKLVVSVQNGDLLSAAHGRINYGLELRSPQEPAFVIAEHDTNPIGGENNLFFTRSRNGYTQAVANGVPLELWLNMNVAVDQNQAPGSTNYPANAAPAGNYVEVFSFTATSV